MHLKTISFTVLLVTLSFFCLKAQHLHPFSSDASSPSGIHAYSSILSIQKNKLGVYALTQKNGCFFIDQKEPAAALTIITPIDRADHFDCLLNNRKQVFLWANQQQILTIGSSEQERMAFCNTFFAETVHPESIAIDSHENIYIGTKMDGVFMFTKEGDGNYNPIPKRISTINDELPSNQVQCLYQGADDIIWIGTDAGIASIKDGIVHNYSKLETRTDNRSWPAFLSVEGHSKNHLSQSIQAISSWGNSLVLAGEDDIYRALLSKDSIEYLHKYHLSERLSTPLSDINALMVDMDGNIWVAGNHLLRYNIGADKLSVMSDIYTFKGQGFLSVMEDLEHQQIWIGTIKGGLYALRY